MLNFIAFAIAAQAPAIDLSKFAPYTSRSGDGDYVIGPNYTDAPELKVRDDVPHGKVFQFVMDSADSLRFPGWRGTDKRELGPAPFKRDVAVYIPAQYQPGTPAPLIVSQDRMGLGFMTTILDNMIADHRLPPIVAVMINPGPGFERSFEYDTPSAGYADFIEDEVLPKISHDYNVTFTTNPDLRMTMGGSSGGSCALSMAWFRPDLYHRVLSYSGSFTNLQWPPNPMTPHGAWDYHEHLVPESPRKPIRTWMEVGDKDIGADTPELGYRNWPIANVRLAQDFKDKHYHYQFVFAQNAVHVDGHVVRQTLPEALEWVWRGARP
jgi:hypothetical protein